MYSYFKSGFYSSRQCVLRGIQSGRHGMINKLVGVATPDLCQGNGGKKQEKKSRKVKSLHVS